MAASRQAGCDTNALSPKFGSPEAFGCVFEGVGEVGLICDNCGSTDLHLYEAHYRCAACGYREDLPPPGQCQGCPFSFTPTSEKIQNYGCLPEPMDIAHMRVEHGRTWACHDNPEKPCVGATKWLQGEGLPHKVINQELLTEQSDWHLFCRP